MCEWSWFKFLWRYSFRTSNEIEVDIFRKAVTHGLLTTLEWVSCRLDILHTIFVLHCKANYSLLTPAELYYFTSTESDDIAPISQQLLSFIEPQSCVHKRWRYFGVQSGRFLSAVKRSEVASTDFWNNKNGNIVLGALTVLCVKKYYGFWFKMPSPLLLVFVSSHLWS